MRPALRRLCSAPDVWGQARSWLARRGLERQTEGIVGAMKQSSIPPGAATSFLEGLGEAGLGALVEAVDREEAARPKSTGRNVNVVVNVPRARQEFEFGVGEGHTLYDAVQLDSELTPYLECACEGKLACSTCHVIVDPEWYAKMPPPDDAELDMLDLAWGVTETSRLGCQLAVTLELDGLKITLPEGVNNYYEK